MKLIIAEKPSVARAITDFLGSGSGCHVLTCRGHLLEPVDPHGYDPRYQKWSLSDLPLRRGGRWLLEVKPDASIRKLLSDIGRALKSGTYTEVVHAGDPDPEGQLLVDEVLEHFGWTGKTSRVMPNAIDDASLKKAFSDIRPNAAFRNIRNAAEARQIADWIIGMNLTRAVTKGLSVNALVSIGRVQTPTLAMVVRRHFEIAGFVEQTFWTLDGHFKTAGGQLLKLKFEPDPRITDRKEAGALLSALVGQIVPLDVKRGTSVKRAPMPFDMKDFQSAAEKLYGWDMKRSLEALQASYDNKYTSYPRTDCCYMPEGQAGEAVGIARGVAAAMGLNHDLVPLMRPSPRIYNNKKVAEHHGLAPTSRIPGTHVDGDIRKAWALVSFRFLMSLMPDAAVDTMTVTATLKGIGDHDPAAFAAKFDRITNREASWKRLEAMRAEAIGVPLSKGPKADDDEDDAETVCPKVADGERSKLMSADLHEGRTTPPEPFTQASLAQEMSQAAKYVSDPKQKERLKESKGIGTSATRSNIILGLITKGFLQMKGKRLDPTELGVQVIQSVPKEMSDVAITAQWEEALRLISRGEYSNTEFVQRIEHVVEKRLAQIAALRSTGVRITASKPAPSKPAPAGSRGAPGKGRAPKSGTTRKSAPRSKPLEKSSRRC